MVEDDVLVARSLERALRYEGHAVTIAATVTVAEALLAIEAPDLLLLDREVVGRDGWSLKAKAAPSTRVVLMTGNPPAGAPEHYLKGERLEKLFALIG
jgi:DNA-binding response OmpR family regulator